MMRRKLNELYWRMCVLGLALAIVPTAVAAELAKKDSPENVALNGATVQANLPALALVKTALRNDAAGNLTKRSEFVSQALAEDVQCSAAHWAAGEVKLQGTWTSIDQAPQSAAKDTKRGEYLKRRDEAGANVPDQLALGKWCLANGLGDEARAHFLAVVGMQADHREAIEALGMTLHRGQWIASNDLAAEAAEAKQAAEDLQVWQPKLAAIGKRFASAETRDQALADLRAISDPAAIGAIHNAIGKANATLSQELVGTLRRMPQQSATQALVRLAVLSPSQPTRAAATKALGERPYHCYVPLLLSGLAMPIEANVEVANTKNGVGVRAVVSQEGETRDRRNVEETHLRLDTPNAQHSFFQQDALAKVMQSLDAGQKQVDKANRKSEGLNQKILRVLKEATGEDLGSNPRIWWNWWHDYTDTYASSSRTTSSYERRYEYRMPYYVPNRYTYASNQASPQYPMPPVSPHSCFGKGTLVWALHGLVPIEELKAGDRVLSQDPDSGELAYQVVLATTLRPDRPMLQIDAGDDSIVSTQGHLFWVAGESWQMAKELKAGQRLQGPTGSTPIVSIRPGSNQAAYNLIVANFGTYFIGKSQLLVHDNTPRKATLAIVPGLAVTD